ncbi:hypothetical protein T4B_1810 [Trichinella pseudospiralis]|nr:hypothetical protein T4A_2175 [Trichinella pseudospiralis]KRY71323.1 hypothetical protein T4A_670 [Trichinella pseudospiralis]KRZ30923.1 hypothetical protein T4B_5876 [Trichinella pseudospiralis]KRZ30931.1 hypothetical protein T4B_1810 [Trichinella pseudospiralis]KRZ40119.1 hypothetical protein T4C_7343 [Trichinella pseudospiralis]
MLTRDVHAELIYFTITGRVIQKLRRFLAWRGRPEVIHGGRITARILRTASALVSSGCERVEMLLLEHRIYWKFISEKAVWMGSYWSAQLVWPNRRCGWRGCTTMS